LRRRKRPAHRLTQDEAFRYAVERGEHLRRRDWTIRVGSTLAALALVGGGLSFALTSEGQRAPEPAAGPTDIATPTPQISVSATPSVATSNLPLPSPTPTKSAPLVCRNSFDPRCSTFRWDPQPHANQPIKWNDPSASRVDHGNNPTPWTIEGSASVIDDGFSHDWDIDWGDGTNSGNFYHSSGHPPCFTGYGPWDPPTYAYAGRNPTGLLHHSYEAPGRYTVTVTVTARGGWDIYVPGGAPHWVCQADELWAEKATTSFVVDVTDPSPSPSPSQSGGPLL
jgi:hypothetical protein